MTKPLQKVTVVLGTVCCAVSCLGGFHPLGAGARTENKDGNILVTYDRDAKNVFVAGCRVLPKSGDKKQPSLSLTNCLYFIDAKLDKQHDRIAVVFCDGLLLRYESYVLTNSIWHPEQSLRLVEYNLDFTLYGNCLDMLDFNTIRASFIKKGERFSKVRPRGSEQQSDRTFLIRITERGQVLIDGQERKSLQWHPTD